MAKDKRSRDQKRKAKLAERARKHPVSTVTPYAGDAYRQPKWALLVYATELAIYETIRASDHQLKNDEVQRAFTELVHRLRQGLPAALAPEEEIPVLTIGHECEFLIWNIRSHWTRHFRKYGKVVGADLIGVLRTLLYSIEAHQHNTGRDRGYVAFVEKFLEESGPTGGFREISAQEAAQVMENPNVEVVGRPS
jgi:hypothetical protein